MSLTGPAWKAAEERCRRAQALAAKGKHAAALAEFEGAIALNPAFAAARHGRATALLYLDRAAEALPEYTALIGLDGGAPAAYNNRGHALERLGRHAEALADFETAIRLRPSYAAAHSNRGDALRSLGRLDAALESYETATQHDPRLAQAIAGRGNVLADLGRPDEALVAYAAALAVAPRFADAHHNRAAVLYKLGRAAEAVAGYGEALAIDPRLGKSRYELGLAKLLLGDAEGWRFCEARKQAYPEWFGWLGRAHDYLGDRPIERETLLVVSEQGFGDTIHFARFARLLADRCERLALCVQPGLTRLLAANLPFAEVVESAGQLPPACCALLSAPLALGLAANPVLSGEPYLTADATLAEGWEQRLPTSARPRVGLAWAGAPHHLNDRNRSIELARLAPLLAEDVDWVCLQRDLRPGDGDILASAGVAPLGDQLTDFAETAALIDRLDLVITVDAAVAHLAAALGKPTWILLPVGPDWRWGLSGTSSGWYDSAQLFRQSAYGDWGPVIGDVADALRRWRGARPPRR